MARGAWSDADVVVSLLGAARRPRDRLWITRYFASRRGPIAWRRLMAPRPPRRGLLLRGLAGPLHVTPESGGLATYYEIVTQRIYGPDEGFGPRPGEVVFDVGANIGVFTLWASARIGDHGRVVAIEPVPIAFVQLRKNTQEIRVATPVSAACGDRTGEVTLHYPPGRISVASVDPREDRTESVTVPLRPLTSLVEEVGAERIDFLKVDVEGLELEVLAGAGELLSAVRAVAVEVEAAKAPAVVAHLAAHGLWRTATLSGMWGLENASVLCFERAPVEGLSPASGQEDHDHE